MKESIIRLRALEKQRFAYRYALNVVDFDAETVAPEGSAARQSGQDFLWYLWCGKLSPLYGRSAMTTFERLYVEDASTHTEVNIGVQGVQTR